MNKNQHKQKSKYLGSGNKQAVMCNETGQIFESSAAASRWLWGETEDDVELTSIQVRLSRHLTGYAVNGKLKDGSIAKWHCREIYGYTFKKMNPVVKKTAKDLFEELGWTLIKDAKYSTVWKLGRVVIKFEDFIYFISDNDNKDWRCAVEEFNGTSMKLHQAINQQCKDKGWI